MRSKTYSDCVRLLTGWSKCLIGFFMLIGLSLGMPAKSLGYVLQAEQIIPFMAANASQDSSQPAV